MRGTDSRTRPAVRGGGRRTSRDGSRQAPSVVVWEADGSLPGGQGYGSAITARLAAAGIVATSVPLTRRRPTPDELAAPAHVLSGGVTPSASHRPWVRRARLDLEPVLRRAMAGRATVTGICFGAQLIAATLAGPRAVRPNPRGMEAGLTLVRPPGGRRWAASDHPGVGPGVGPGSPLVVAEFHHHLVDPAAVVALGGEIVLSNDHTTVQAFAIGPNILGVQFHPELDPATILAMVREHRHLIRSHGTEPSAAAASIDRLRDRWRAETFDDLVARPAHRAASSLPSSRAR